MTEPTPNDPTAAQVHADQELVKFRMNAAKFLTLHFGQPRQCRECPKFIWFVKHPKTGNAQPITDELIDHHADCPAAQKFRRPKTNGNQVS